MIDKHSSILKRAINSYRNGTASERRYEVGYLLKLIMFINLSLTATAYEAKTINVFTITNGPASEEVHFRIARKYSVEGCGDGVFFNGARLSQFRSEFLGGYLLWPYIELAWSIGCDSPEIFNGTYIHTDLYRARSGSNLKIVLSEDYAVTDREGNTLPVDPDDQVQLINFQMAANQENARFQIAKDYETDSCNSIADIKIAHETLPYDFRGRRVLVPNIEISQTQGTCDGTDTKLKTYVDPEIYSVRSNQIFQVLLPKGYSIIKVD